MKKTFAALLFLALLSLAPLAPAQAAPMPGLSPSALKASSGFFPAAAELGEQFQALVTGDQPTEIEPEETFGTRALGLLLSFFNLLRDETGNFVSTFAALPQLSEWTAQQMADPTLATRWSTIFQRLFIVVGGAFVAGWTTSLILTPLRRRIRKRTPHHLGARIGILSAWLLLSLIPVIVFVSVAVGLLDQGESNKYVRYVVMNAVYALAVFRLVRLGFRFLLAPNTPNLRLVPLTDSQAGYINRWLNAFTGVIVFGYFVPDIARLVRMPTGAITAFTSLIAFVVVAMTIAIILQKRSTVSIFLRGDLSAARPHLTLWESLRLWLARSWHVLAISYLVIGSLVTTFGGGFEIMQRGTLLTLLSLFLMRFALYGVSRFSSAKRHVPDEDMSFSLARPVFKMLLRLSIWTAGAAGVASAWGLDVAAMLSSPWGQRVSGSVFSITSTVVLVTVLYEVLESAIARRLRKSEEGGRGSVRDGRARTLLPMLNNAAIVVFAVIVGLVTLSELGINIAPLLAGAGVLGVAVGFGSQTLIKDFLTGLFIVLEDSIAVDDTVAIGTNEGVVESMTLRTVRLRDSMGNLHILPFSEITKIVNQSKAYSFARMDIGVAYNSDLDHVMQVMREVGDDLSHDPVIGPLIIAPTEVQGVETLGDSSITVRCRLKTKPGRQAEVRRAYLLRIKQRFDSERIEIPFPTVTQIRRKEE